MKNINEAVFLDLCKWHFIFKIIINYSETFVDKLVEFALNMVLKLVNWFINLESIMIYLFFLLFF